MDLHCQCSQCGGKFRIDAKHAGRKIRCPKCQAINQTSAEAASGGSFTGSRGGVARSAKTVASGTESAIGARGRAPTGGMFQIDTTKPVVKEAVKKQPAAPAAAPATNAPASRLERPTGKVTLPVVGAVSPATVSYLLMGAAAVLFLAVGGLAYVVSNIGDDPRVATGTQDGDPDIDKPEDILGKRSDSPGIPETLIPPDDNTDNPAGQPPVEPPQEPPPIETPPESRAAPLQRAPPGYEGWVQDFGKARGVAEAEKKDVLLAFVQSDGGEESRRLQEKIFETDAFRELAASRLVTVVLDFPVTRERGDDVENIQRNVSLLRRFRVQDVPTVIVTDASGLPYYAQTVAEESQWKQLEDFSAILAMRDERDRLIAEADGKSGAEKLTAAAAAVRWLDERRVTGHYAARLREWVPLGEQFDPRNEQGDGEVLFAADWEARLRDLVEISPERGPELVAALNEWRASRQFRDGDRGAKMHIIAAMLLRNVNRRKDAARHFSLARACEPKDEGIREAMREVEGAFSGEAGSGSGFVVAPGYILTNAHVIGGEGEVFIRVSETEKAPAKVIAHDVKGDLALLKCDSPAVAALTPLDIEATPLGRGEEVAAFGFPLGSKQLNFTKGPVATLPAGEEEPYLTLDCRINPGNSGGPLCDSRGRVVGVVTAKMVGGQGIDSYGLALPTSAIQAFLQEHLKAEAKTSKKPRPRPRAKPMTWSEVDKRVSGSVLMVIKMEE